MMVGIVQSDENTDTSQPVGSLRTASLIGGCVATVLWVAVLVAVIKVRRFKQVSEDGASSLFWGFMSHRSFAAALLPVWGVMVTRDSHWSQQHCALINLVYSGNAMAYIAWSFFLMREATLMVANPFRAYAQLKWRAYLAVLGFNLLGFLIYAHSEEAFCDMRPKCHETISGIGTWTMMCVLLIWLKTSAQTFLASKNLQDGLLSPSLVRQQSAEMGMKYAGWNFVEATTLISTLMFRTLYPCLASEDQKGDNSWFSVDRSVVIIVETALILGALVVGFVFGNPIDPSRGLISALWTDFSTSSVLIDNLACALRQEILECITQGVVCSLEEPARTQVARKSNLEGVLEPLTSPVAACHHQLGCEDFRWEFIDVEVEAFANLRRLCTLDKKDYIESIQQTGVANGLQMSLTNSKSGSFFYFTHDNRFLVKSLTPTEVGVLRSVLASYTQHLTQNPQTLLPLFYGLHAIRYGSKGEMVYFVVMSNVNYGLELRGTCAETQRTSYDLKGSWVKRQCKPGSSTMKDANLKAPVLLNAEAYSDLMNQLEQDSRWLRSHNIMDYSLLMTVVEPVQDTCRSCMIVRPGCRHQLEAPMICVGLIDILQRFDVQKRGELMCKTALCADTKGLSCMAPQPYQARFMDAMRNKVFAMPELGPDNAA